MTAPSFVLITEFDSLQGQRSRPSQWALASESKSAVWDLKLLAAKHHVFFFMCSLLPPSELLFHPPLWIRPRPPLLRGQESSKAIHAHLRVPVGASRSGADFTATAITNAGSSSSAAVAGFVVAASHSSRQRHSSQQSATRKLNRDFLVRTCAQCTRCSEIISKHTASSSSGPFEASPPPRRPQLWLHRGRGHALLFLTRTQNSNKNYSF